MPRTKTKTKIKTKTATYQVGDLLKIPTFARRKGKTRTAVAYQIRMGSIEVVKIDGTSFISWVRYHDFEFREENNNTPES